MFPCICYGCAALYLYSSIKLTWTRPEMEYITWLSFPLSYFYQLLLSITLCRLIVFSFQSWRVMQLKKENMITNLNPHFLWGCGRGENTRGRWWLFICEVIGIEKQINQTSLWTMLTWHSGAVGTPPQGSHRLDPGFQERHCHVSCTCITYITGTKYTRRIFGYCSVAKVLWKDLCYSQEHF